MFFTLSANFNIFVDSANMMGITMHNATLPWMASSLFRDIVALPHVVSRMDSVKIPAGKTSFGHSRCHHKCVEQHVTLQERDSLVEGSM